MDDRVQYPSWSGMKRRNMTNKWVRMTAALLALTKASLPNLARALLQLQEHAKTPDLPTSFTCHECNQTTSTLGGASQALQHQRNTHAGNMDQENPYIACCYSCKTIFFEAGVAITHYKCCKDMRTQKKVVLGQVGLITIDKTKKTVNCWYSISGRDGVTYVISVKEQSKVAMLRLLQLALRTPTFEPGMDAHASCIPVTLPVYARIRNYASRTSVKFDTIDWFSIVVVNPDKDCRRIVKQFVIRNRSLLCLRVFSFSQTTLRTMC